MNEIWIYVLIIQLVSVASHPIQDAANIQTPSRMYSAYSAGSNDKNLPNYNDEKVISVRITSSVAVERGNGKLIQRTTDNNEYKQEHFSNYTMATEDRFETNTSTTLPPTLRGANIEFIKQLNAKKETKLNSKDNDQYESSRTNPHYDKQSYSDTRISENNKDEAKHTYDKNIPSTGQILLSNELSDFRSRSTSVLDEALKLSDVRYNSNNTNYDDDMYSESKPATEEAYLTTSFDETEFSDDDKDSFSNLDYKKESKEIDDSVAESSIKSILEIVNKHSEDYENIENVPLARSLAHSPSSKNYIQGLNNKPPSERESSTRLTTVSFNILHDAPKTTGNEDPGKAYRRPNQSFQGQQNFYNPTIYSRPSQIYSEPAKYYSEPAKIYSEPAKIYSEPAKIYSEPAKVYSEPAKFYSEPASLHLKPEHPTDYFPWLQDSSPPSTTTLSTTPVAITSPNYANTEQVAQQQAEKNYEVDERESVLSDGRSHGVQESTTEKCQQDNCKVGYVVKGRTFNKYRVEERTSDGFIVGEYGVVRNEDGALRGVRYTADSEASPRLIYDTLMKFLQLK